MHAFLWLHSLRQDLQSVEPPAVSNLRQSGLLVAEPVSVDKCTEFLIFYPDLSTLTYDVNGFLNAAVNTAAYRNLKPVGSADFDQNYEPVSPSYPPKEVSQ